MLQNLSNFEIVSTKKSCSDWAQKLKLRVLGPRDSENQLRSAWFFSKKIFFGIFLTTILKINPKINPNINPFFLIIIIYNSLNCLNRLIHSLRPPFIATEGRSARAAHGGAGPPRYHLSIITSGQKIRSVGTRRGLIFFQKKIFFGIFLTTILNNNPKIKPKIWLFLIT